MEGKKRKAAGFWFSIIAFVAALVGLAGMYFCSSMYAAYAYKTINMMLIYGGTAAVLILISALLPSTRLGNHNVLTAIFVWAAIGLMMSVVGTMILDRILMIAGLFSYNSQNTIGWQVFYVTVVGVAGYLVSCLALIIASFTKTVKIVDA